MQVTRDNLDKELDGIRKAIDECSFFALDMEFTGLNLRGGEVNTASDTLDHLQERFHKQSAGARSFLVLQFGLCCMRFDGDKRWVAKTWSFYLFPTDVSGTTTLMTVYVSSLRMYIFASMIAAAHARLPCSSPPRRPAAVLKQEATRSTARCRPSSSLPRCEALAGLSVMVMDRSGLC
jgi:hypothetical protein